MKLIDFATMNKNEKKTIGATLVYVAIWSIGLFCTTFFSAVSELSLMKIFDGEIARMVIAPSCVVLALFLWEEAENIDHANLPLNRMRQLLKWNFIILGAILIFFALVVLTTGIVRLICLLISWVGIAAIKFISKYYSDFQIEINKV